jgi:hypothetical protein
MNTLNLLQICLHALFDRLNIVDLKNRKRPERQEYRHIRNDSRNQIKHVGKFEVN